jgi:predicted enzyme related to lactoylglutathione lyase
MLSKTRIGAVGYNVSDIQRSYRFYRDVLGLPLEWQKGHGGEGEGAGDWLMGETAGGVWMILFEAPTKPGNSPIVVFELENGGIDGIVEQLAKNGAAIVTPVSHAPDGGMTADFADPDGHVISLHQNPGLPR